MYKMHTIPFNNIERLDTPEAFRVAILNLSAIRYKNPQLEDELIPIISHLRCLLMDSIGWIKEV